MKKIIKYVFLFFMFFVSLSGLSFAKDYIFFYGNGCPHCAKVEKFFEQNDVYKKFSVDKKEVYFNRDNLALFGSYMKKLGLTDQMGVPMLIIDSDSEDCGYLAGTDSIISFFQNKLQSISGSGCELQNCTHENCDKQSALVTSGSTDSGKSLLRQRLGFFAIMLPAAISDSINPCAFAVMLLLLTSILSTHKSRKRTLLAGALFSLAVFVTYLAMGIGLFNALASSNNTFVLKLVVGILGLLVGLANLKDYFWYGKWFVMEVPLAWRPKMQDIIYKVSSPIGAFFVGILVSLFLLPCSSGPYFTILGYLSSQSKELTNWGYLYLIIYNLIFVLPMFVIAILVAFGYSTVDKIAKIKHKNTKLIHLIVGILMLGLGIYVLTTL